MILLAAVPRLATPFDIGAGHIVPNAARTPGLVYAATGADYDAFVCGIEAFPIDAERCDALAAPPTDIEAALR